MAPRYQEKGVDVCHGRSQCRGAPGRARSGRTLWKADIAKDHPNVVMILAGRWEVSNRTYDGRWTNIENPTYAAYVQRELRYAVQVAGSGGASVVLMTAPCYDTGEQPDGQPWPEDSPARLAIYNGIVRQRRRLDSRDVCSSTSMRWPVPAGTTRSTWTASRSAWPTASTSRSPEGVSSPPGSGPSSSRSGVSRWLNPASSPSPASLKRERSASWTA